MLIERFLKEWKTARKFRVSTPQNARHWSLPDITSSFKRKWPSSNSFFTPKFLYRACVRVAENKSSPQVKIVSAEHAALLPSMWGAFLLRCQRPVDDLFLRQELPSKWSEYKGETMARGQKDSQICKKFFQASYPLWDIVSTYRTSV